VKPGHLWDNDWHHALIDFREWYTTKEEAIMRLKETGRSVHVLTVVEVSEHRYEVWLDYVEEAR
jgi:hypothetical protein